MRSFFVISSLAMFAASCTCGHSSTVVSQGEVQWEWPGEDGGMQYGTSAYLTFPLTDMGTSRERTLTIRNMGVAALTLKELVHLDGTPTFLNAGDDAGSVFAVKWAPSTVVPAAETTAITVTFRPPLTGDMPYAQYTSNNVLKSVAAEDSQLWLSGRGLAPDCYVPEVLDFGSIPLSQTRQVTLSLRNAGLTPITATLGEIKGGAASVFPVDGFAADGTLRVAPGAAPEARVTFHPSQAGDFRGEMTLRRSAICPIRTVKLRGRAIDACITWHATPEGDPEGKSVNFGPVAMRQAAKGAVSFFNNCSFDVTLTQLRTSSPVFTLLERAIALMTTLVPKAVFENDSWVNGVAELGLELRPVALGPVSGQLQCDTTESTQVAITVDLRGTGVGPRVQVDPLVLALGTVGYAPQHLPRDFAERIVEISNTGVQSMPPTAALNLHLGLSARAPYWSVRTLNGAASELCVGEWDTAHSACRGTLPADVYDPDGGIAAGAAHGLELPVRVVPETDGAKSWEVTFYTDDPFTPHVAVQITATALSPSPVVVACPAAMRVNAQTNVSLVPVVVSGAPAACRWAAGLRPNASNGTLSTPTSCTGTSYFADVPGVHNVTFEARDAQGVISSCSVEITAARTPVTASCPASMTVEANTTVTLATSVSAATNTHCDWSVGSRPAGSTGGFSAPASCVTTTYLADQPGLHVVSFRATDVVGTQAQCATQITVKKTPVTVTCPAAMTVDAQTQVTLPVSVMSATTPACGWSVSSRPAGSTGTFSAPASCASTRYFADLPGVHVVRFQATDAAGTTNQCTVQITAQQTPITAACPAAMTVEANTRVTLPTTVTSATAPACAWTVASRPAGSAGTFSAPASCVTTAYFADQPGVHTVSFKATDAVGTLAQCSTQITVKKTPVSVTCPAAMTVDAQTQVTLPTTVSSATAPSCGWSVTSRPAGSTGAFSAPASCASTRYFADVPGAHVVRFQATDTAGTLSECSVQITARQTPVTAMCPAAMTVDANTRVTLPTAVTSATPPACAWAVGARPAGSAGTFSAPLSCVSTTYLADQPGLHTLNFKATDAVGTVAQCSTQITVNKTPVTVRCPAAMTVDANTTVTLATTVGSSTAPTCAWAVGSRPATSNGTFSAPASCTSTTYFGDVAGEHLLNFSARDTAGTEATCSTQVTVKPKGGLWVELTWDVNNDVDLHVLHPNAGSNTTVASWGSMPYDVYYRNQNPVWGGPTEADPHLDRDDTAAKGPENTRINVPALNTAYSVGVHLYRSINPGAVLSTVKVYCDGTLMTTRTRSLNTEKSLWVVGTVTFPSNGPCRFQAVDTVLAGVPTLARDLKP